MQASHLGRVVMQQDVIPAAVAGNGAFQYQCIAQGQGGSGYIYVCNPPSCILPAGMGIDANGTISVTDSTVVSPGVKKVTLTLQAAEGSIQQDVLVEVVRPNSSNPNWCPRGSFGGDVTTVALAPDFATSNFAYAGGANGGLYKTQDAGLSWSAVPAFGPVPVTAMAADGCATPLKIWAVTGSASRAILTDVGPLGGVIGGIAPSGAIIRFDTVPAAETIIDPINGSGLLLPASWTGRRRRLVQAYGQCAGPMLASDSSGGILWRDPADNTWKDRSGGLAGSSVLDIAYGYGAVAGTRSQSAALIYFGVTPYIYNNNALATNGSWTQCVDLSAISVTGRWHSLGLTPDGKLIAATTQGETAIANLGDCASPPVAGPAFVDSQGTGPVSASPSVNGFVFPPCYGAAGQQQVYAYTDSGIYYTANFATTNLTRFSSGLLSEEVGGMAISPASCADKRIIAGTRRGGPAWGDDQGFCQGQLKTAAAFNGLATGSGFTAPAGGVCFNGAAPYDLFTSSANQGIFHSVPGGMAFFTAGDTREQALRDITSARNGAGFKLYGLTYSGVYDSDGSPAFGYTFSKDALLKIRGSAGLTDGSAYAISDRNLYASYAPSGWLDKLTDLGSISGFNCFAGAADLATGGRISTFKDLLWIACGAGGLVEAQIDAANGVSGVVHSVASLPVRKVAATAVANGDNRVLTQVYDGGTGLFSYFCGVKFAAQPAVAITFTACGTGLPVAEEALQLVAEPARANGGSDFWALFPSRGLFRSIDAGASFTAVAGTGVAGGLPRQYIPVALVLADNYDRAANRANLALLVAGQGVYYSADGGQTYCAGPAQVSTLPASVRSLTTSVFSNDILFAGTDSGAFFSDDNGVHWHNRSYNGNTVQVIATHKLSPTSEAVLTGTASGIWRSLDEGVSWTKVVASGDITAIARDFNSCNNDLIATVAGGSILASADGGATWTAQSGPTDGVAATRQNGGCAGFAESPDGATAAYWAAGSSSGASYSPTGATWTAANGGNDYTLPATSGFASVSTLGGSPSKVLIGHSSQGLWRTLDGGDNWRKVSASGSGLELTSQNASTLITATTAFATTDVLVGMTGSSTGGVYLSGDSGEHWTQVNAGFDPNNLSISSLVKTSCSGCPVQYYSGSYGGGMYTRTITVLAPPFNTTAGTWCTGSGCTCGTGAFTGNEQGGQAFKLCGSNFQNGLAVEFDGVPAVGCTQSGGTVITCTGTPPHVPGNAVVRVRNPDTRVGVVSSSYTFVSGTPRTANFTVVKSGGDAALGWSCAGCDTTHPARIYRAQNPAFSIYLEIYNGGTGAAFTNTGAISSAQSYFWSVE